MLCLFNDNPGSRGRGSTIIRQKDTDDDDMCGREYPPFTLVTLSLI